MLQSIGQAETELLTVRSHQKLEMIDAGEHKVCRNIGYRVDRVHIE